MNESSTQAGPTRGQLRYLRALAQRTETTFVSPKTKAQAAHEIARLRQLPSAPRIPDLERDPEEAPEPPLATAVRDDEVRGYGISAIWRHKDEPAETAQESKAKPVVRRRIELARYRVSAGERVLYALRANGRVCVVDAPVKAGGCSYVVERNVQLDRGPSLCALIVDYVAQARDADRVPMATSLLGQELEADA